MIKINLLFKIQEIILYKKFDIFYQENKDKIYKGNKIRELFYLFMGEDSDKNISLYTKFLEYILYNKR